MIGIIVAMESELKPYLELRHSVEIWSGKSFYRVDLGDFPAVVALGGIGKVNAAHIAAIIIHIYKPQYVISTGVSGSLHELQTLDTVVADACCQHDVDTTALGDPPGFVSTVNKIYFEADKKLSAFLSEKIACRQGILACGDQFVADEKVKKKIRENFGACACDMESGAIAQVCHIENTPFAAVRCITDGAEEGADLSYAEFLKRASEILFGAVYGAFSAKSAGERI